MAGSLPKPIEQFKKMSNARIAIISSMWHSDIIEAMVDRAIFELLKLDVKKDDIQCHQVPGSLELPYAASQLFTTDTTLDLIIAFGVILKGITTHDATVLQNVVHGFSLVTHTYNKPIINEVIGVDSIETAWKRAGADSSNKGVEAVFAASEILHWKRALTHKEH